MNILHVRKTSWKYIPQIISHDGLNGIKGNVGEGAVFMRIFYFSKVKMHDF